MIQTCRWNSPHFSGYLYINRSWFHLKYTFIALHSVSSCVKSDHLTFISPGYIVAFWYKSFYNPVFDCTDDFLHQTTQFKWKQGTFLVILHDGIYIYRYTFSIFQYTFIGWVWGGPAAHLYQVHAWDTPPPRVLRLRFLVCVLFIQRFCDTDKSRTCKVRRINNMHKRKRSLSLFRLYSDISETSERTRLDIRRCSSHRRWPESVGRSEAERACQKWKCLCGNHGFSASRL